MTPRTQILRARLQTNLGADEEVEKQVHKHDMMGFKTITKFVFQNWKSQKMCK